MKLEAFRDVVDHAFDVLRDRHGAVGDVEKRHWIERARRMHAELAETQVPSRANERDRNRCSDAAARLQAVIDEVVEALAVKGAANS